MKIWKTMWTNKKSVEKMKTRKEMRTHENRENKKIRKTTGEIKQMKIQEK